MNAIETQIENLQSAVASLQYAAENAYRHTFEDKSGSRRNLLYCDIRAITRSALAAERAFDAYDAARNASLQTEENSPLLSGNEPAPTLAEVRTSVHELATK